MSRYFACAIHKAREGGYHAYHTSHGGSCSIKRVKGQKGWAVDCSAVYPKKAKRIWHVLTTLTAAKSGACGWLQKNVSFVPD
jgi:hypothetical protein